MAMGSFTSPLTQSLATPRIPTPQVQTKFGYSGSGWNYPGSQIKSAPARIGALPGIRPGGGTITPRGDVPSGSTPQAPGYGNVTFPGVSAKDYIDVNPNVIGARQALVTQGGLSNQNLQQTMQQALVAFGDPTAFARGGAASPYSSLADIVGSKFAIDPATSALARSNTVGPGGTIGNSIVAQLHLAAMNSMNQAVTSGAPLGAAVNSSQLGFGVNQANIQSGQAFSNAISNLQQQIFPAIQSNLTTQQGLQDALSQAILKVPFDVAQNPSLYPVSGPHTEPVGGNVGIPPVTPQPYGPNVQTGAGYGGTGGARYGDWHYPLANTGYVPPTHQPFQTGAGYGGSSGTRYGPWRYP